MVRTERMRAIKYRKNFPATNSNWIMKYAGIANTMLCTAAALVSHGCHAHAACLGVKVLLNVQLTVQWNT